MKRSTWIMFLILVLLAGATWFILSKEAPTGSDIDLSDRQFALNEDSDRLDKIVIKNRKSGTSVLLKKGDKWYFEDGSLISKYVMAPVLQTLNHIQIHHIPHRNANENIIREMGQIGIKVELYDGDEQLRSYYVGGSTPNERGTYYLVEGATQPYVMHINNFEGSVRNRLVVTKNEWLDRSIVRSKAEDIVSVSVEYPKERNESFRIFDLDSSPKVEPLYRLTDNKVSPARRAAVEAYLKGFTESGSEYIDNDNPVKDSILALIPFAIIKYELSDDTKHQIRLFPLQSSFDGSKTEARLSNLVKIERYFADCSWGDFLLVQQRLIGSWLRPYDYFLEE